MRENFEDYWYQIFDSKLNFKFVWSYFVMSLIPT